MTPEAEQSLLDRWNGDYMVGNLDNDRNDRLARAIILDNRQTIAEHYGFNNHTEYLAELNRHLNEKYPTPPPTQAIATQTDQTNS